MKHVRSALNPKFFVASDLGCFGWDDRNVALHHCSYNGAFKDTWRGIWKVKSDA